MLIRDSIILVGQGRAEIHPLVNSAILRKIFGYLDVRSLKSVRATCTIWNEEAYSLLQNKSKVRISWPNDVDEQKKPTLLTFMKYVASVRPENVFFRNYTLHGWSLHSRGLEMIQFWLQCGQHIRHLLLNVDIGFYEKSYVRNVFYNWTPNMESLDMDFVRFAVNDPNYNPLSLKNRTRRIYEDNHSVPMEKFEILEPIQPNYNFRTFQITSNHSYPEFPLQWKELFVAYPNLETLRVRPLFRIKGESIIKDLLTDLIDFQRLNPNELSLKIMEIFANINCISSSDCIATIEHFEEAMKLNFKLESLDINVLEANDLSYSTISKYVNKLSSTLKTLKLVSTQDALTLFPPLGKMTCFPRLNSLSLHLKTLSSNNVDFLQNTPNLKKLQIDDIHFPRISDMTEPRLFLNTITLEPLNTLRHLHIGVDILTEDCIRKIGEWFPNLFDFRAIFDNNLLWATYKFLYKSVEILRIHGKGITDAGITGIEATDNDNAPKPSSSKSITQEPLAKRPKENGDEEGLRTSGTSIAQMKKLRHLTINSLYNPNDEAVELTDDAVYKGFIHLTELTYFHISRCLETITEKAIRDLCSRRNIMTLVTENFYRGSGVRKGGSVPENITTRLMSFPRS